MHWKRVISKDGWFFIQTKAANTGVKSFVAYSGRRQSALLSTHHTQGMLLQEGQPCLVPLAAIDTGLGHALSPAFLIGHLTTLLSRTAVAPLALRCAVKTKMPPARVRWVRDGNEVAAWVIGIPLTTHRTGKEIFTLVSEGN